MHADVKISWESLDGGEHEADIIWDSRLDEGGDGLQAFYALTDAIRDTHDMETPPSAARIEEFASDVPGLSAPRGVSAFAFANQWDDAVEIASKSPDIDPERDLDVIGELFRLGITNERPRRVDVVEDGRNLPPDGKTSRSVIMPDGRGLLITY